MKRQLVPTDDNTQQRPTRRRTFNPPLLNRANQQEEIQVPEILETGLRFPNGKIPTPHLRLAFRPPGPSKSSPRDALVALGPALHGADKKDMIVSPSIHARESGGDASRSQGWRRSTAIPRGPSATTPINKLPASTSTYKMHSDPSKAFHGVIYMARSPWFTSITPPRSVRLESPCKATSVPPVMVPSADSAALPVVHEEPPVHTFPQSKDDPAAERPRDTCTLSASCHCEAVNTSSNADAGNQLSHEVSQALQPASLADSARPPTMGKMLSIEEGCLASPTSPEALACDRSEAGDSRPSDQGNAAGPGADSCPRPAVETAGVTRGEGVRETNANLSPKPVSCSQPPEENDALDDTPPLNLSVTLEQVPDVTWPKPPQERERNKLLEQLACQDMQGDGMGASGVQAPGTIRRTGIGNAAGSTSTGLVVEGGTPVTMAIRRLPSVAFLQESRESPNRARTGLAFERLFGGLQASRLTVSVPGAFASPPSLADMGHLHRVRLQLRPVPLGPCHESHTRLRLNLARHIVPTAGRSAGAASEPPLCYAPQSLMRMMGSARQNVLTCLALPSQYVNTWCSLGALAGAGHCRHSDGTRSADGTKSRQAKPGERMIDCDGLPERYASTATSDYVVTSCDVDPSCDGPGAGGGGGGGGGVSALECHNLHYDMEVEFNLVDSCEGAHDVRHEWSGLSMQFLSDIFT